MLSLTRHPRLCTTKLPSLSTYVPLLLNLKDVEENLDFSHFLLIVHHDIDPVRVILTQVDLRL